MSTFSLKRPNEVAEIDDLERILVNGGVISDENGTLATYCLSCWPFGTPTVQLRHCADGVRAAKFTQQHCGERNLNPQVTRGERHKGVLKWCLSLEGRAAFTAVYVKLGGLTAQITSAKAQAISGMGGFVSLRPKESPTPRCYLHTVRHLLHTCQFDQQVGKYRWYTKFAPLTYIELCPLAVGFVPVSDVASAAAAAASLYTEDTLMLSLLDEKLKVSVSVDTNQGNLQRLKVKVQCTNIQDSLLELLPFLMPNTGDDRLLIDVQPLWDAIKAKCSSFALANLIWSDDEFTTPDNAAKLLPGTNVTFATFDPAAKMEEQGIPLGFPLSGHVLESVAPPGSSGPSQQSPPVSPETVYRPPALPLVYPECVTQASVLENGARILWVNMSTLIRPGMSGTPVFVPNGDLAHWVLSACSYAQALEANNALTVPMYGSHTWSDFVKVSQDSTAVSPPDVEVPEEGDTGGVDEIESPDQTESLQNEILALKKQLHEEEEKRIKAEKQLKKERGKWQKAQKMLLNAQAALLSGSDSASEADGR